jgi:hypothetical protein
MASRNAFKQAGHNMAVVMRAVPKAGTPAMRKVGVQGTSLMKQILSTPGQGRIYPRGSSGRVHRASAPGDPPAVDFGLYRSSWDWSVRSAHALYELLIGTPSKIAAWLEYGTRRGLKPRPHARVLHEVLRSSGVVTRTVGAAVVDVETNAARSVPRG